MNTIGLLPLTGLLLLLASCGGRSSGKAERAADPARTAAVTHQVTLPKPPSMLSDSAKLDYLATRYWESFDFADTTWIADTAALEQAFANWTGVLQALPEAQAARLTGGLIARIAADTTAPSPMLLRFAEVAEHYFNDPNSPFRDEALFIPVLEALVAAPGVEDIYKVRPRAQLATALKNRPGMRAADFAYTTGAGRTGRLSQLGGDYTLLLFYNPGCHDCARVERYIEQSQTLAPMIASGRLTVLAVYADEDLAAWRSHLPQMPAGWTVGYNASIRDDNSYGLPAIPNLYLLDRDKRVILKDAPVEEIEAWLEGSAQ